MQEEKQQRIDKFLWSVRIFKTRSDAADACKKGKVIINDQSVKASRSIKAGETLLIKKGIVNYTYEIIDIPKSRVSAKILEIFIKNLTPPEEMEKLKQQETFFIKRDKGSGRPTKKERRIIDKLRSQ